MKYFLTSDPLERKWRYSRVVTVVFDALMLLSDYDQAAIGTVEDHKGDLSIRLKSKVNNACKARILSAFKTSWRNQGECELNVSVKP